MTDAALSQTWLEKAALYEILTMGLALPTQELAESITSGEYAEALTEIIELNGASKQASDKIIAELSPYGGKESEKLFHILRAE